MDRRFNGGIRLAQSLEELGLVNRNGRHFAERCRRVIYRFLQATNWYAGESSGSLMALGGTQQSRDLA